MTDTTGLVKKFVWVFHKLLWKNLKNFLVKLIHDTTYMRNLR